MAFDTVTGFINSQIFMENKVVTYRSLSRCLGMHMTSTYNSALTSYLEYKGDNPAVCTTYLVAGTSIPIRSKIIKKVKEDLSPVIEEEEWVPGNTILLVREDMLQFKENIFKEVTSEHVYSLSPLPITDSKVLTAPTAFIRERDSKAGGGTSFGRITAPKIACSVLPVSKKCASSISKTKSAKEEAGNGETMLRKTNSMQIFLTDKISKSNEKVMQVDSKFSESKGEQEQTKNSLNRRASFFEPKRKKGPKQRTEVVPNSKLEGKEIVDAGAGSMPHAEKEAEKAGTEELKQDRVISKEVRLQKRTVLSDDDGEELPIARKRNRKSILDERSRDERSLRAMMDVDDGDDSVDSRGMSVAEAKVNVVRKEEAEEEAEEEVMEKEKIEGHFIDKKPRKARKQKIKEKDIPVDSKGRKKRRVTKTRKEKDRKGRTITVDYSSWESGSEEESISPRSENKNVAIRDTTTQSKEHDYSSAKNERTIKESIHQHNLKSFFTPRT